MSYLKTEKVHIESINEDIEITELSALGQRQLVEAWDTGDDEDRKDPFGPLATAVKLGTEKWRECELEEILAQLPLPALREIADAVTNLSGIGSDEEVEEMGKNSESGLSDVSSLG